VNEKIKNYLFYASGIALVAATVLYAIQWEYAPYLYAVASAGVALYYLTTPYKGENKRIRRLHGYLVFAGLLLVASSFFMFRKEQTWLLCLLISAALQLYVVIVRKE
jgi:energy-converting hydrogenase Eha subunit G